MKFMIRRVCAALVATTCLTLGVAFAKTIDVDSATIAELNAAFDAGTLTSEALVRMCLARIDAFVEEIDHALHAIRLEQLEELRGRHGVGSIVEGQGNVTLGSDAGEPR